MVGSGVLDARSFYWAVFRKLDNLMLHGQWDKVSCDLAEYCSDRYPVEYGIGAMRFVSDAADRIPQYNSLLNSLNKRASSHQMRGLNPIPQK